MSKKCEVGDTLKNCNGVECTVVECGEDFYMLETPDGSLENITVTEVDQEN